MTWCCDSARGRDGFAGSFEHVRIGSISRVKESLEQQTATSEILGVIASADRNSQFWRLSQERGAVLREHE